MPFSLSSFHSLSLYFYFILFKIISFIHLFIIFFILPFNPLFIIPLIIYSLLVFLFFLLIISSTLSYIIPFIIFILFFIFTVHLHSPLNAFGKMDTSVSLFSHFLLSLFGDGGRGRKEKKVKKDI